MTAGPVSARPTDIDGPATASQTRIHRFNWAERGLHWTHAITFLALLATGATLLIPGLGKLVGNHLIVLRIHLAIAIFYVGGPLLWIVLGDKRRWRQDAGEFDRWDEDDVDWLKSSIVRPLDGELPQQGRFNAGQKLNAIFTAAAAVGFVLTGVIMWQPSHFANWMLDNAVFVHDTLAFVTAILVVGHIYLAAIAPRTRDGLSGMIDGTVRRDWALEHHPKWVADLDKAPQQQPGSTAAKQ